MSTDMRATQYCEAYARKGTGFGTCARPLDDNGYCDRSADHIEDQWH